MSRSIDIQEREQLFRTARVAQLAQGLGIDLADAFAGDVELLDDLLQRVVRVCILYTSRRV